MIKKDIVEKIKYELENTDIHTSDLADKYGVSKATINNINIGKSHKEDRIYPIRQLINNYFSDNEVSFVRKLSEDGYSAKQIHILLSKGSYSTISNIVNYKTRPETYPYKKDRFLEERRKVFDFLCTPHGELINKHIDTVTYDDAVYVKLLGRFMADLLDTLIIFLPIIESQMITSKHPIRNRDDIAAYLEWGGTAFSTIWWIKSIFNNKVNRVGEKEIFYNDFPIVRFREVDININLILVKEMIQFDTKENYRKNDS